jgi:hypothetical protein
MAASWPAPLQHCFGRCLDKVRHLAGWETIATWLDGDLDGDGARAAGNQPFGIRRAVITSRFAALPQHAQTALLLAAAADRPDLSAARQPALNTDGPIKIVA